MSNIYILRMASLALINLPLSPSLCVKDINRQQIHLASKAISTKDIYDEVHLNEIGTAPEAVETVSCVDPLATAGAKNAVLPL